MTVRNKGTAQQTAWMHTENVSEESHSALANQKKNVYVWHCCSLTVSFPRNDMKAATVEAINGARNIICDIPRFAKRD